MNHIKADVQSLLTNLPDDCTIEDIQNHLYVLDKIHKGLDSAQNEEILSPKEAVQKLQKWITK